MLVPRFCECESWSCTKEIKLSLEEVKKIERSGLVFIVSDCANGPNPDDVLVETHPRYCLYREGPA